MFDRLFVTCMCYTSFALFQYLETTKLSRVGPLDARNLYDMVEWPQMVLNGIEWQCQAVKATLDKLDVEKPILAGR